MANRAGRYWAASWSWVGHALGQLGCRRGAPPPVRDGDIIEYRDNPVMNYLPAIAIVFGNVINYMPLGTLDLWVRRYDDFDKSRALIRLRDHELQHVHQYRRWGPAFIPAYLIAELWARLRRLTGRRTVNWFEKCADDACHPRTCENHDNLDHLG